MRFVVAISVVVATLIFHVVHRAAVSFLEAGAILADHFAFHAWVAIAIVIVRILVAAGFEIVASGLYAVVKTLPLRIAIFRWRLVPAALSLVLRL
jgi:hypothetical protein